MGPVACHSCSNTTASSCPSRLNKINRRCCHARLNIGPLKGSFYYPFYDIYGLADLPPKLSAAMACSLVSSTFGSSCSPFSVGGGRNPTATR